MVKQGDDWVTDFEKNLLEVERNDKDASKPVARHSNLPNNSKQHMVVCLLSLKKNYLSNRHS